MLRKYILGSVISAAFHVSLLRDKEYGGFALATLVWPVPALMWSVYVRYLIWGNYKHKQMVKNKTGCYKEHEPPFEMEILP